MAMLNNQRVIIILIFHCAIKKTEHCAIYLFPTGSGISERRASCPVSFFAREGYPNGRLEENSENIGTL